MTSSINGNLHASGSISAAGGFSGIARTDLSQETARVPVLLTDLRVHDAMQTVLPGTAAGDDLALVGTAFGTSSPQVLTGDLKAAGATTRYARFLFQLPYHYVSAGSVQVAIHCGMETTVSDTSATIDVEAYESDKEGGIGSDLVTTASQSINSLTQAEKTFTVDASGLVAGDWLDIRVAIAINDGATGTTVQGALGAISILCGVKG